VRIEKLLLCHRQARLHDQRGIGVVEVLEQRLLDGGDVVDAFRERARQFLEARVAIEFQRIEPLGGPTCHRHPGLDLRFALDFDFAHLRAQPDDASGQLEEVRLQRAQFALDPRSRDGHFAGLVREPVDDVGAHPQHRADAGLGFDPVAPGRFGRRRIGEGHERHHHRPLVAGGKRCCGGFLGWPGLGGCRWRSRQVQVGRHRPHGRHESRGRRLLRSRPSRNASRTYAM
jgi:hypothetical protein